MSLVGNLSTMPLPDVLQWLASALQTGTLRVERNKLTKWIQLDQGMIVGCSSDDPPQRLGQFLLSREMITAEQLRQALAAQEESGKHLGTTLVEMGMLSTENLVQHLEAKAEETIYSVFDWDNGVFRFDPGLAPRRDVFSVNLQVQDVLLRGMRRFDDMQRIRQVFEDSTIVLRYTSMPPGPEIFENRMARTMYAAIDGDRSIGEILLHVHGSEYIVYKFLYELHRSGYVEIAGRKALEEHAVPPPPVATTRAPPSASETELEQIDLDSFGTDALPTAASAASATLATPATETLATPAATATSDSSVDTELARARALMDEGEAERALELLDRLYRQDPEDDALRRLTAEAEAEFVHKAYQHYIPPNKIPLLTRPVESLGSESISPQEFFMLSRIDGTWDVKSIVQVSPLREVDALKTLKRMRELGMIELRDPS